MPFEIRTYSLAADDGIQWPDPTDRCSKCGNFFGVKKIGRIPATGEFYHYNGCPRPNLQEMTEAEILCIVYADAGPGTPVGLRDNLTVEEICRLGNHPAWLLFSEGFRTWVRDTQAGIADEDLAQ